MSNKQAVNNLLNGVNILLKKQLSIAPIDKTFTGIIKQVKEENKYDVLIDQKIYLDIPSVFYNFKPNDIVKVKIPQGQYSQMYIESKINLNIFNEFSQKISELTQEIKLIQDENKILKEQITLLNTKTESLEDRVSALETKHIMTIEEDK